MNSKFEDHFSLFSTASAFGRSNSLSASQKNRRIDYFLLLLFSRSTNKQYYKYFFSKKILKNYFFSLGEAQTNELLCLLFIFNYKNMLLWMWFACLFRKFLREKRCMLMGLTRSVECVEFFGGLNWHTKWWMLHLLYVIGSWIDLQWVHSFGANGAVLPLNTQETGHDHCMLPLWCCHFIYWGAPFLCQCCSPTSSNQSSQRFC